jgi:predicted flap endonuclease-1-like 5' DNA nuclease
MRVVVFFVLLLVAAWAGFALGWMANAWRHHRRGRDTDRSLRYQVATKEEEYQRMREALEHTRAELIHLRGQVVETDDLTKLPGVGEATARELERLGYRSYRDVANWTEADISRVSTELRPFPDRIARHQWTEQARALHREKYGQEP